MSTLAPAAGRLGGAGSCDPQVTPGGVSWPVPVGSPPSGASSGSSALSKRTDMINNESVGVVKMGVARESCGGQRVKAVLWKPCGHHDNCHYHNH